MMKDRRPPSDELEFRDFFGLRLAFADRVIKHADLIDQKPYLFLGNPWNYGRLADPKRILIERCGITCFSDYTVGIASAEGSWFRSAALLKSLGAGSVVILLPPQRNERLVRKRVGIRIDAIGAIFIPNYKCGYASFRKFCFDHFDEFAEADRNRSASLNQIIDFSSDLVNSFFIFSTIRHPLSRFRSLYFDKFSRPSDHINFQSFEQPFRLLLDKSELTPEDVLDVICQIPDEYSDPHWKSQHFNTTFHGRKLINHYVRMEHIEEDFDEISRRINFNFALPKVLSTAEIARNHRYRSYFERETIREKLARRYPNDFSRLGYS